MVEAEEEVVELMTEVEAGWGGGACSFSFIEKTLLAFVVSLRKGIRCSCSSFTIGASDGSSISSARPFAVYLFDGKAHRAMRGKAHKGGKAHGLARVVAYRAVRPVRWMYVATSSGQSACTTQFT